MSNPLPPPVLVEQVYTELLDAFANRAPVGAVREIVEKCPDVLQKVDYYKCCILNHALRHGVDLDVVQYLIEQSPPLDEDDFDSPEGPYFVSTKDDDGDMAIHIALTYGASDDVIRCLLDACPHSVYVANSTDGDYPAHVAARHRASLGTTKLVVEPYPEVLLERNLSDHLPLTLALTFYDRQPPPQEEDSAMDVIRYLLHKCPESLGDEDEDGLRAFHYAVMGEAPPEVLTFFLQLRPEALREACKSGQLPVHYAASSSTPSGFASFQLLLSLWPESIKERTEGGDLPLHIAIARGERTRSASSVIVPLVERVRYMLDQWPEAIRNKAGPNQLIAIHRAVMSDNRVPRNVLELLLDEWPESILELSKDGESILHLASQTYELSLDKVRLLVERDERVVDARSARDGSLPVHAFAGQDASYLYWTVSVRDVLGFLVEVRPESVTARDDEGRLPVHRALDNPDQKFEVVEYLVEQGPETLLVKNRNGSVPLHAALASHSGSDRVTFLVDQCPESLRARDNDGNLAIHLAASLGYLHAELTLLYIAERDPDSIPETNGAGSSPLHLLVVAETPSPHTVSVLVAHRPDAAAVRNRNGLLPVHLAAGRGGPRPALLFGRNGRPFRRPDPILALVQCLIGARPDTALAPGAICGRLPLHFAATSAGGGAETSLEVTRYLLQQRPDAAIVATSVDGRLPLHCALEACSADAVDNGRALHLMMPLVKLLVEAAPESLQVRDTSGRVPLLVAALNPSTPLDVLWFLMTECPASVPMMMMMKRCRPLPPVRGDREGAASRPADSVAGGALLTTTTTPPTKRKRPRRSTEGAFE